MTASTHDFPQTTPDALTMPVSGSFGFLVSNSLHRSSPFAGMSHFVWFLDKPTLERALATAVVAFDDQGPKTVSLAQYAPEFLPVAEGWENLPVSLDERQSALNEVLRNDSHITWIGASRPCALQMEPSSEVCAIGTARKKALVAKTNPLRSKTEAHLATPCKATGSDQHQPCHLSITRRNHDLPALWTQIKPSNSRLL